MTSIHTVPKTEVLRLANPFAVGGRRLCYVHPEEPGKCIKVLRVDEHRTVRSVQKWGVLTRFRRAYDNNADEQRALKCLFRRIGPLAARHFPTSYGMVATDRGPGLVLDLIRDHDGGISRSVRELITIGLNVESLQTAYDEFAAFLLEHVVVTRSILDHNIAVQFRVDGSARMYLIDGIGDPAWLPIRQWIPSLGRARIRQRIATGWKKFLLVQSRGGVSQAVREQSHWGQGLLNYR